MKHREEKQVLVHDASNLIDAGETVVHTLAVDLFDSLFSISSDESILCKQDVGRTLNWAPKLAKRLAAE